MHCEENYFGKGDYPTHHEKTDVPTKPVICGPTRLRSSREGMFLWAFLVLAHAVKSNFVQMERGLKIHPENHVEDWELKHASDPSQTMEVGFSMKTDPVKRAKLEKFFWEVSDPKHPSYCNYLSGPELQQYIAASNDNILTVVEFLELHGVTHIRVGDNRDMVYATASISKLESMLQTKFGQFYSEKYRVHVDRITSPYYLPAGIAAVVALVDGIAVFPGLRVMKKVRDPVDPVADVTAGAASWPNYCPGTPVCNGRITPNITALMYNSYSMTTNFKVAPGNGVAVAEFQTQKYDESDLDVFGKDCGIPTIQVKDVNGFAKGSQGGVETMLDLEFISGNGLGIPLVDYFYYRYSLLTFTEQINAQGGKGPLVYSVSYGNDEVQQTSEDYMFQCNTAFMAAATLGYSILFASGDQGVWGRTGVGSTFHPDFPAGSPYITAVGGTDFTSPNPSLDNYEEKCSTDGGGGFSNTFDMPPYQAKAVNDYISAASKADVLPPKALWNASGRAYPDIAAEFGLVVSYCIVANGKWEGVAGTSASCPVVAHGISVLNNIQLLKGKKPLGFLNPWIYQTFYTDPTAFTDITKGQNNEEHAQGGFVALPGWDPCSGVGTPNFARMAKYLP
eukprot:g41945.t1